MKLLTIFPIVKKIFTIDANDKSAISSSAAQREQMDNKNKVEKLLKTLQSPIYVERREILTNNGVTESTAQLTYKVIADDFKCLVDVEDLNAKSATLAHAIKLKNRIIESIGKLSIDDLAHDFNVTKPVFTTQLPVQRKIAAGGYSSIDLFCGEDNVDSLIDFASGELLDKFGSDNINELIKSAARAAVYGKQVHPTDSPFLRKLANADMTQSLTDNKTDNMIVMRTNVLAYEKSDFAEVDTHCQTMHSKYQMERNGLMKQLKDLARALHQEYNKEYQVALKDYESVKSSYNEAIKQYTNEVELLRSELLSEAAELRIIIS